MNKNIFEFKEITPLPDLGFEIACHSLFISEDGRKLLTSGVYKPTIKLFDFKTGIMKFERHLTCDPIKLIGLEDDLEKFAILKSDKTVEFHIKGGLHEKIRMPNQPKDLLLNKTTAEIYLGGNYNEIYRFNLEQGRFLKSIACDGAYNMSISNMHGLLGAVSNNNLTFIDSRTKETIFTNHFEDELLSIAQDETGLHYSIGTYDGVVYEYDFRSKIPQKKINFDNFVKKMQYSGKNLLVSTDKKINILDDSFNLVSSIQPGFSIYDFAVCKGLVFVGGESSSIKTFISENIGQIPSWIEH